MIPLRQQVVVITGASSGIGKLTALKCARSGAKIVAASRTEASLIDLQQEIVAFGGECVYVVADVADYDQVQAIAEKAIQAFGCIDTWVSNAGMILYASVLDTTPEEYKRLMEVNYLGHVHSVLAALPHMKVRGGALIHVSSIGALCGFPNQSAYAGSKHAINGFLDALRSEIIHNKYPIRVTNIMPATCNTPGLSKCSSKLGLKPHGPPPIYDPELVAENIILAMTISDPPLRDVVVGTAGKFLYFLKVLFPSLYLWLTSSNLVYKLETVPGKPQSPEFPNNIFKPYSSQAQTDDNRIRGDFGDEAIHASLLDLYRLKVYPAIHRWSWGIL
jgi:NAD(P)-dependent dehydrogenase (short-subunit alcohol dehydrogenase family)